MSQEKLGDDEIQQEIKKGVTFTTPLATKIRNSDKLYIVEELDDASIGVQR